MTLSSNPVATQSRLAQLREYFDREVLGANGFTCSSLGVCRRSALLDGTGQRKVGVEFAAGQLPHVGTHYDLSENGRPLRVLTIAMETGRPAEHVTLDQCRAVVREHINRPMTGPNRRNPHMQGVTHAVRLARGRAPGADRDGEVLELVDGNVVHLFDTCAMTNIRLCSAFSTGSTGSRGTTVMSRRCLRHLAATVRILEPKLCIVQGGPVANDLEPLVSRRADLRSHLARVTFAGVETLLATFTHPAAPGTLRWGGLNGVPYLHDTVAPTLLAARAELRGPVTPPTPAPPDVRPAGVRRGFALPRRREEPGSSPIPGSGARSTQQVAADARTYVARQVERRGGSAREVRVGRRTELRVVSPSGTYSVRVSSRRSGTWQTSIREGEATSSKDRFWVFVDLAHEVPSYFIPPSS